MRRTPYELVFALAAIVLLTAAYAVLARNGLPRPGGPLGHGCGLVGFALMLATETLYSLRKHVPGFHWGPMQRWLQWHVFMGLVGPYLVLLHSGGKFHGLAGVLTLLTAVMVCSGFVGRYIYTAVPRTPEGAAVAAAELEAGLAAADRELKALGVDPKGKAALVEAYAVPGGWAAVLGRPWLAWRQRRRVREALRHWPDRARTARLERLLAERYRLLLQVRSLAAVRGLLALWHALHVPLGGVVFTLAFVHVGAALYYATLLR